VDENKKDELTPEQAIKQIEAKIEEKTKGLATAEDIAQIKTDIAAAKELAEKTAENSKEYDDAAVKTAIAALEGKMEAMREEPKTGGK